MMLRRLALLPRAARAPSTALSTWAALVPIRARAWSTYLVVILLELALVVAPYGLARAQQQEVPGDYPVPGGWFYAQESRFRDDRAPFRGYTVVDDREASFWTEFRRYGGVDVLGYPVSRRYRYPDDGGYLYQAFQRGILQWRPEESAARLANVSELFTQAGLDGLLEVEGIPRPRDSSPLPFAADAARRMNWLTEPRFLARFLWDPVSDVPFEVQEAAWELFGLPQTFAERPVYLREQRDGKAGAPLYLPYIVQRFQKGAMQLFLEDRPNDPTIVPGDGKEGCVTITAIGRLARRLGSGRIIPPAAVKPEPPPPPDRVYATWYVPPLASPGQRTIDFELVGIGFDPGEPVTVRLSPTSPTASAPATVRIEAADSDGSFDRLIRARVTAYTLSVQGERSGRLLDPALDTALDLSTPTQTRAESSKATFC